MAPQKKDFHIDYDYHLPLCHVAVLDPFIIPLGRPLNLFAMVTRSTLPGPNPQCDRIAQCVFNVASTLRLAGRFFFG